MARKRKTPPDEVVGSGGSARPEDTVAVGGNGGGESGATPSGPGGRTGSTIDIVYGRRPMRGYPITEGELGQLFGIGLLATICFSLAAGVFGFAVDVTKDLALAPEIPQAVVSSWETAKTISWYLSGILFVTGIVFLFRGRSVLNNIKKTTIFPDYDGTR